MLDDLSVRFRRALDGDLAIILSPWLKSFCRYRDSFFRVKVDTQRYFRAHHALLERLLPRCECMVACAPDCVEQVFGWAAFDSDALHYVYVKQIYRGKGIAGMLLETAKRRSPVTCSHMTPAGRRLLMARNLEFDVDPYTAIL